MIDLSGLFQVYNEKFKSMSKFSLAHAAKVFLGTDPYRQHNAVEDALISIRCFKHFKNVEASGDPAQLATLRQSLLTAKPTESFAKRNNTYDGVCMGFRKKCTCKQPFFY